MSVGLLYEGKNAIWDISVEKILSMKKKMPSSIGIMNASFVDVILKISFLLVVRAVLRSHNFAKIMFDLERPFLICYYSLSWDIDQGIIAAPFASDCAFPFIFFFTGSFQPHG